MSTDGNRAEALNIRVAGRVQGVGFRYSAQQRASRLRLSGWVRNERDGSVQMHCEGQPEQIAALLDWLESGGPSYARIDSIDQSPSAVQGTFHGFSVEY